MVGFACALKESGPMPLPKKLILVRHGDTLGESSVRYHGRNDVALSEVGREQMRGAAHGIDGLEIDLVVASSLSRARESAAIAAPGLKIALEDDFREVHFGRWEGLTAAEIEALDPELFSQWQGADGRRGFDYPEGERRADFRRRVCRGIDAWVAADAQTLLAVAHKGVIRVAVEHLTGVPLEEGEPALGSVLVLESGGSRGWQRVDGEAD